MVYETENNNLRTSADLMTVGTVMNGIISARNDVDCYKVNFPNSGSVTFTLDIPNDVNYRMRIFANSDSDSIAEDVSTTLGTTRTATAEINVYNTYYIVISPQTSGIFNATEEYSLNISYNRREIALPSNRTYNWNQFYHEITAIVGTAGCSWTCALDVANIYGPYAYNPDDMPANAWVGYCQWYLPNNLADKDDCIGSVNSYSANIREEECLPTICSEIDNNRPVILELQNSSGSQHFVVAYGYKNNGTAKSDILVFDPGVASESSTQKIGTAWTLPEAENLVSKTLNRIRTTSGR